MSGETARPTRDERVEQLARAVKRWREKGAGDYWLSVSYMGPAVNRFGDHDLTVIDGALWHRWEGRWRRVVQGSDYWLFAVPFTLAWARDLLTAGEQAGDELVLAFDDEFGYVKEMRFDAHSRDAKNFTFEVRRFGTGAHPEFEEPRSE